MGEYVDFKTIKAEVSVEAVAARYGVGLRKSNGSHERGKCPLPSHPAGEDTKSFSINTAKQVWICHSTTCAKGRRGKKGGDVIELVSAMESCSLRDAGLRLAEWYDVKSDYEARRTNEVGEHHDPKPSESEPETVPEPTATGRYGKYDDLAQWIEKRVEGNSLSRAEQAAYLSVLGQIEELAEAKGGDA